MIACFDVHYAESQASAAAVTINDWTDPTPHGEYVTRVEVADEYQAGELYRRELKPLLAAIECVPTPINMIVIDAYCILSADGAAGLGAHLYRALKERVPVIGAAKNRFRDTTHAVEVNRGGSVRPLFITAIGIAPREAAGMIDSMAGRHRIPTILKRVDRLARDDCDWHSPRQ